MIYPANAIAAYCNYKGYPLDPEPGHYNIVYIEGLNPDFTLNSDAFDGWNDLRLIIDHDERRNPYILFSQVATTEPGRASTFDPKAKKAGGVARLPFGFHKGKWVHGWHKVSSLRHTHPALVQKSGEVIMAHRDVDRNGKRTGDPISAAWGINQHGTAPNANQKTVGAWSAGCLVGKDWELHLQFLDLLKKDLRYLANPKFAYSTTIIAGDDFLKFRTNIG